MENRTELEQLEEFEHKFWLADLFAFKDNKGNTYNKQWFKNRLAKLRRGKMKGGRVNNGKSN